MARRPVHDLAHLLDGLDKTARDGEVTVRELRDAIGRRAFAPMLLVASLIGFTPLGAVPGVPTTLAVIVILIAGQIALGRDSVWAPRRLLDMQVDAGRLQRAVHALKPFARRVDKVIRPRLAFLTAPPWSSVIVAVCLLLAVSVPPLEFIPLVDWPLWGAMAAFSLALFAHDGVLAIVAFALTAVGIYLVAMVVCRAQ
jgi:hypothetical protein